MAHPLAPLIGKTIEDITVVERDDVAPEPTENVSVLLTFTCTDGTVVQATATEGVGSQYCVELRAGDVKPFS